MTAMSMTGSPDNVSLALAALEARLDKLQTDLTANNNAFFLCTMGLVIFCELTLVFFCC